MTKVFMFAAGAVLMLWFVGTCNTIPVVSATLTLGGTPYRPEEPPQEVGCRQWHVVGPGETQWAIATRYAGHQEKHQWLRQARRVSGLSADDDGIRANQVLCVRW